MEFGAAYDSQLALAEPLAGPSRWCKEIKLITGTTVTETASKHVRTTYTYIKIHPYRGKGAV